ASPQNAIVDGPGVIVSPFEPLVLYVPPTWLQSAVALNDPSVLNVIAYWPCSSAGTTPWNAGTFSVTAVRCQAFPVRLEPPPQAQRSVIAPSASAMNKDRRIV